MQAFGLRKRRIPTRGSAYLQDCVILCLVFLGRPQACVIPRCENVGRRSRRTPSARNDRAISEVFRDRSARCAAVSRSFSPRGLLWLFLRKKEQKRFCKKCGSKAAERTLKMVGLRWRRLWPARRLGAAVSCKPSFLRTFGLAQKYQKVKHGEKPRVTFFAAAGKRRKIRAEARRWVGETIEKGRSPIIGLRP